jgi:hypothetical protein
MRLADTSRDRADMHVAEIDVPANRPMGWVWSEQQLQPVVVVE